MDYPRRSDRDRRSCVLRRRHWLLAGLLAWGVWSPLEAQVEGRVFFRDGSPCVLCRLEARVGDERLQLRADLDGFFQIPVEAPQAIRSFRSGRLKARIEIEDDFVFLRLNGINPQLEAVFKEVRQQLQFVSTGLESSAEQSVELTDCFLAIHSLGYYQGRALYSRVIDVDLTGLISMTVCPERENCVQFRPALVDGHPLAQERFAAVGVTPKPKKQDIPALLQAVELLTRACGNVGAAF